MPNATDKSLADKTKEILGELSTDEQQLLVRIIRAEQDKLHMKTPRDIKDDLWKALTEVFK
jgi:hypothetical protein